MLGERGRPRRHDEVLHACGGKPRAWRSGRSGCCGNCGSTLAPDRGYREGHAAFWCSACQRWIGLCAADGPVDRAEQVVAAIDTPVAT